MEQLSVITQVSPFCDDRTRNGSSDSNGASSTNTSNSESENLTDETEPGSSFVPRVFPVANAFECRKFQHPWMRRKYKPNLKSLSDEISDLHMWLKPTAEELVIRRQVFQQFATCLRQQWPNAEIKPFGSVATNSFLPSSDIDICMYRSSDIHDSHVEILRHAKSLIEGSDKYENILLLERATIPLLKITEKETQLNIDLCIDLKYVSETALWIENQKRKHPSFELLLLILKQYLHQHSLNEPFTGGLPSYALAAMIVYFLETQRKFANNYYSQLLIHFFNFFGSFDYTQYGLRLRPRPQVVPKAKLAIEMNSDVYTSILWLVDPIQPGNNLGKAAHNILLIKRVFNRAYVQLNSALCECKLYSNDVIDKHYYGPMLSLIISFDRKTIERRNRHKNYLRYRVVKSHV